MGRDKTKVIVPRELSIAEMKSRLEANGYRVIPQRGPLGPTVARGEPVGQRRVDSLSNDTLAKVLAQRIGAAYSKLVPPIVEDALTPRAWSELIAAAELGLNCKIKYEREGIAEQADRLAKTIQAERRFTVGPDPAPVPPAKTKIEVHVFVDGTKVV